MKTKLLFIVSVIVLVISCGRDASSILYHPGFPGDVYEFSTLSGRSCVYARLDTGGGLSCDWKN